MSAISPKVASASGALQTEEECYFSGRCLIPYFPNELLDGPELFERRP
jgi:hypothetical protein